MVQIDSLHGALWESETIFWLKHAREIGGKVRNKLQSKTKFSSVTKSPNLLSQLFSLPISVATTLEASDCSVQLRPDVVSLQSKEPLCRTVAGTLVASVQWEVPQIEKEHTTTVKLVPLKQYTVY